MLRKRQIVKSVWPRFDIWWKRNDLFKISTRSFNST